MGGVLLLATAVNYVDRVALNQLAPEIKAAVNATDVGYGVLESGFQLAFGAGAVLFGWVVDRWGVRRVYPLAVVGWSVAGFLTGFASDYWSLLCCRILLGLFEAGNWPCGVRTVREVMPPAERSLGVALFSSGTGVGAILTPLAILGVFALTGSRHWQIPFRVVGVGGLLWVLLWLFTVPRRVLAHHAPPPSAPAEPFAAVFRLRRFWLLVVLVLGVNTSWHTFRVWLPLYLRKDLGYSADESLWFNARYYVAADLGSWLVGGLVLWMARRGEPLFRARLRVYAVGVLLVMASAALPFCPRALVEPFVGVTGFASLGLFAFYFAMSQEVSGRHQGKVTGVLGAINSVYLAAMYWVQGWASDAAGAGVRAWVLAAAGLPAAAAMAGWWGGGESSPRRAGASLG